MSCASGHTGFLFPSKKGNISGLNFAGNTIRKNSHSEESVGMKRSYVKIREQRAATLGGNYATHRMMHCLVPRAGAVSVTSMNVTGQLNSLPHDACAWHAACRAFEKIETNLFAKESD